MTDLLFWIIFGIISGYIASILTRSNTSIMADIVLGVVGAVLGGFIMNSLGYSGVTGLNFYSIAVSVVGAVILITVGRMMSRQPGI